jgi:hypothetical protein
LLVLGLGRLRWLLLLSRRGLLLLLLGIIILLLWLLGLRLADVRRGGLVLKG